MRHPPLLLLLVAACGGASAAAPEAVLPAALEVLILADRSDEVTTVVYPHNVHARLEARSCADCHHPLADDPEALPAPCSTCHPLEPEEGKPPDL